MPIMRLYTISTMALLFVTSIADDCICTKAGTERACKAAKGNMKGEYCSTSDASAFLTSCSGACYS
ncbi:hypothetical protein CGRA01v4_08692 [Colletotrichum graminicola]|nr:hypothetical protein CGRA01v4_08692 [Colletotrichum graminicola]